MTNETRAKFRDVFERRKIEQSRDVKEDGVETDISNLERTEKVEMKE